VAKPFNPNTTVVSGTRTLEIHLADDIFSDQNTPF
jgi:hypothetical protein